MTKNFYPLIGKQVLTDKWVIKFKDRPDLLFAYYETDFISASPCPLLYWDQIPLDWKINDPGFRIFLRSKIDDNLPTWILNPLTSLGQKPPFYTFTSRPKSDSLKKVLVIHHHASSSLSWYKIQPLFPEAQIKWISYASPSIPEWPKESKLDFRLYPYIQDWKPDGIYDLNYGQGDTISPIHLRALHDGASFINDLPSWGPFKPKYCISRWYGEWKIFE